MVLISALSGCGQETDSDGDAIALTADPSASLSASSGASNTATPPPSSAAPSPLAPTGTSSNTAPPATVIVPSIPMLPVPNPVSTPPSTPVTTLPMSTGSGGSDAMPVGSAGMGGDGSFGGSGGTGGDSSFGASNSGGSAGIAGAANSGGVGGATEPEPEGGLAPVVESAGCGQAGPQTGSANSPLNVSNHQYYVKLPGNYDADQAYPVLFMFHPTNNPLNWAEDNAGFEDNEARDAWIRVYPGAANNGSGWGAGDVSFFEPLYETITSSFCVDESRVFAAGESSGGDFSSILGCEFADKVRAVGPCATKPVNGYSLNAGSRSCSGQAGAVIIHGKGDTVVGPENGPATRDFYKALNHCDDATLPVEGYTDNLSNCVEFQGCDAGYPVIWCQHEDPNYGGTNHGWPAFAADMLWEHFSSY